MSESWRDGPCQGSCEEHRGELRIVHVDGWGPFRYCEEAIAEDKRRGLVVETEEEKGRMIALGKPGAIPEVIEKTSGDVFENIIRVYGVTAACEWFGHKPDSEFTAETIRILVQRSEARQA